MTVDVENCRIVESAGPKAIVVDYKKLREFIQTGLTKQKLMKHQENRKVFLNSHLTKKDSVISGVLQGQDKNKNTSLEKQTVTKGLSRLNDTPDRTRNFENELINNHYQSLDHLPKVPEDAKSRYSFLKMDPKEIKL